MELRKIKEEIFYIADTTNIGVFQTKKGFVLIDAPIDKDKAKKIIKILESNGIKPTDLILTHHHADHTGGAKYLKERLNLTVYTSAKEKVFIENPILEPIYLSLGGEPFKPFLTKWIKSKEVKVDRVLEDGDFEIEGKKFRILSLPGHSIDMIGVEVDGVIFSADTFFSIPILKKYIVPYFHNPYRFVESIKKLKNCSFDYILPSHGELYTREEGLKVMDENVRVVKELGEKLLNIIHEEKSIEEIIESLSLPVDNIVVSFLITSSILSYLFRFVDEGKAEVKVKNGTPKFIKV